MKRIFLTTSVLLLFILLSWLLWPLAGEQYHIEWDASAIAKKQQTLSQLSIDTNADRPNIMIILVDDLGKMDFPLYGGNDIVKTPNIERMAAQGVVFNRAYVSSPVCSPSRAALLTGRYQQRFGYQNQLHDRYLTNRFEYFGFKWFVNSHPWVPKWMDDVPNEEDIMKQGLPPSEITLPEVLQQAGYKTGLVGKWHLGWSEDNKPCNFGLDYQYGFYASHSLYAHENTPGIIEWDA
ncbi:MAG: sulfatase-like hydrolase/transferase [Cyclobacteriaceae bacterium]